MENNSLKHEIFDWLAWIITTILTAFALWIWTLVDWTFGMMLLTLPALILTLGWKRIKASPPQIGVVTILGQKVGVAKDEGWVLTIPIIYELVLLDAEVKNFDKTHTGVPCNSEANGLPHIEETPKDENGNPVFKYGGTVFAETNITYTIDQDRADDFVNYGQHDGVQDQMQDLVAETLRHSGRRNTWQNMVSSNVAITALLILWLVDLSKEEKALLKGALNSKNDEKLGRFLAEMSRKPRKDVHNMGICFKKINISKILPEGELAKAAEGQVVEDQEHRRDVRDMEAGMSLIDMAREKFPTMSDKDLGNYVQTDRKRATRVIIDAPEGIGNLVGALTAFGITSNQQKDTKGK